MARARTRRFGPPSSATRWRRRRRRHLGPSARRPGSHPVAPTPKRRRGPGRRSRTAWRRPSRLRNISGSPSTHLRSRSGPRRRHHPAGSCRPYSTHPEGDLRPAGAITAQEWVLGRFAAVSETADSPSSQRSDTAIEVVDLTIRYDELVAVDDLSFTVAPGEIVALLGPNGAGKTSTVETLEGFRG